MVETSTDAPNPSRTRMDEITEREINERGAKEMRDINQRLLVVLERAPSDASAELHVRKSREGYKGVLKIYSRQRRFVGGFAGPRFSEVVDRVFEQVKDQIEDWKRSRDLVADGI